MNSIKRIFRIAPASYFSRRFGNKSSRNIMRLKERGLITDIFPQDSSKEITDLCNRKDSAYVYAGFDPTADSLHIGNLLILIKLLHWQRGGHNVIALLGGATGRIGDPSGRNTERPLMEDLYLERNLKGIQSNILNIFENHEKYFWDEYMVKLVPIIIENNEDWYKDMNAIEFVGKVGRHFRMGTMLMKQSVKTRLESEVGMSFTEFTYQILQAYDWYVLYQKYGCQFQVGGSDQMGNILSGHNLISRLSNRPVYGMTIPLVTNEEGDKFGKSAGNAIWLDEKKTSPYSFYQFFVRTKDSEVEQLLKYFTFYTLKEIEMLMEKQNAEPEKRYAQKALAEQVTKLVHGKDGLKRALSSTEVLYSRNIESLLNLTQTEIIQIFEGATVVSLLGEPGMTVLNLAMKARCFPTESDAMRIINAGGFYINHQKCKNIDEVITDTVHILPNKITLIRTGKRNYYIVKWI